MNMSSDTSFCPTLSLLRIFLSFRPGQGRGQIHHLLFEEEKVKIWMEFYNDNVLEGHKRSR